MEWQGKLAAVAIEATTGWRWVDARWLSLLLARELLSECEAWLPPAEIQRPRDRARLRKALAGQRTAWAQRLHALLAHEG